MNKLERLLIEVNKANDGTLEEYRDSIHKLGVWVFVLWWKGNLKRDVNNLKKEARDS